MKQTKLVNVIFEIEVDEKTQELIDCIISEFAKTTGMTEEKSRVFVDLIIETGFRRNRDPDLKELLMLISVFIGALKDRLGSTVGSSDPF